MAALTTVCIVGFAPDAPPRELKNLCRFMSGFEGAHVAFAGSSGQATALFVKFNTSGAAALAIDTITGQPFDADAPSAAQTLKAEFARREMEVRQSPAPIVHGGAPPPSKPNGYGPASAPPLSAYGSGGAAGHPPGGALMTVVVLSLREKGLHYEEVQQWFSSRPGYVSQQFNERIDGIFVRFDTPHRAERALQDANAAGYGAEWARRNLDDDRGPPAAQPALLQPSHPPPFAAGGPGASYGASAAGGKRLLGHTGGELVTICILGIAEKGLSHEELQVWLSERSGFVSMQMNDRIGGIFAKFASQAAAEQAMNDANANQFGAEWARRNLDDDRPLPGQAPVAAAAAAAAGPYGGYGPASHGGGVGGPAKRLRAAVGELDTVAVLGCREKEQLHGQGALQDWFQQRPGFVTLQINERIDALFAKFSSATTAEQAIHDANNAGFSAEWARRNLDL